MGVPGLPEVAIVVPAADVDMPAELDVPPVGSSPPPGPGSADMLQAMLVARMHAASTAGERRLSRVSARLASAIFIL
jgi:hypothetical protein